MDFSSWHACISDGHGVILTVPKNVHHDSTVITQYMFYFTAMLGAKNQVQLMQGSSLCMTAIIGSLR